MVGDITHKEHHPQQYFGATHSSLPLYIYTVASSSNSSSINRNQPTILPQTIGYVYTCVHKYDRYVCIMLRLCGG